MESTDQRLKTDLLSNKELKAAFANVGLKIGQEPKDEEQGIDLIYSLGWYLAKKLDGYRGTFDEYLDEPLKEVQDTVFYVEPEVGE